MNGRKRAGAGSFVIALSVFGNARAQPPEPATLEKIRLDYSASAECPSSEAFIESVRRYTTRWTLAGEGETARRFRLTLTPRDGKFVGALELLPNAGDDRESSAVREIAGPDCETVARGMAVAVAVAIDPQALFPARPEEPAEPPAAAESPPRPAPHAVRKPPPAKAPAPRFAVDGRIELTSAVVSRWLPVFSVAFEADPFAERAQASSWPLPRWVRPTFALGARQSFPAEIQRSTVTTELLWTAGLVRLCPVRLAVAAGRLELAPCLEGDIGVLQADAAGSADARRTSKLWIDAALSMHATWQVSGPWFVGAAAAIVVPVSRNRFELGTGTLVSQAPRWATTFGLSGGLRF